MEMKKRISGILRALLPVLYLSYYCSATLFIHTHIVDGEPITHSHPYSGGNSSNPGHSHSGASFMLIKQLSDSLLAVLTAYVACVVLRRAIRVIRVRAGNDSGRTILCLLPSRAPPAIC